MIDETNLLDPPVTEADPVPSEVRPQLRAVRVKGPVRDLVVTRTDTGAKVCTIGPAGEAGTCYEQTGDVDALLSVLREAGVEMTEEELLAERTGIGGKT